MEFKKEAKALVAQMTLEEKASLCSGQDFWHMKGLPRLGLFPIMLTDGPHGLRKQVGAADQLGINDSVKATCFPTAATTACSFDVGLMEEIGTALGEESLQEEVSVLLGPAVNIKRSPLCGRNFEYISEDPCLTGKLAAALVRGVQSKGIGVSVKHYAANNQETRRMSANSVVDERAMREIYLSAYETIVKESQPWTFMCAYNPVNGTYAADNKHLLTDVLRDEWGFDGLVMTDWGAVNDRVEGIRAGLDLEMPSSGGHNDARIVEAVRTGKLDMAALDEVVLRLTALILKAQAAKKPGFSYDIEAHHRLAKKAAAESCVLLKNEDNILPLTAGKKVAVIGAFAKNPRYQGAGSSKINPIRMTCAFDALTEAGFQIDYAEGYSLKSNAPDEILIRQACETAKGKDTVLLFVGLPDEYESEGFDRTHINMPESHNRLIEAVAEVNPNTVAILQLGAPVAMPWVNRVKGILAAYLGGQAGGVGCADVLTGAVCPGGKLTESWPLALIDTPCYHYFPGKSKSVEYRESIFVGYRYYDRVEKAVAYPFGFGLSYTSFAYSDLEVLPTPNGDWEVSFTITNTGSVAGAEAAQLYVGLPESNLFRPVRELKGFSKVFLKPEESARLTILLEKRSLAYYDTALGRYAVETGRYTIEAGASGQDIRLTAQLDIDGEQPQVTALREKASVYWSLPKGDLRIDDAAFSALYGRPLPPTERQPGDPFTVNSTLADIQDTKVGKQILKQAKDNASAMMGDKNEDISLMVDAMMMDLPLRVLLTMGGESMTPTMLDGIVNMLNGKMLKGMFQMWKGKPKK